jgi:hypothetical protein
MDTCRLSSTEPCFDCKIKRGGKRQPYTLDDTERPITWTRGKGGAPKRRKVKGTAPHDLVGLYTLQAVDPQLESAWFHPPSSLSSENLLSQFAFKFNVVRYNLGAVFDAPLTSSPNAFDFVDVNGGAVQFDP